MNPNAPTSAEMVTALCELESGLSDWEVEFVDQMFDKVKTGVTQKQYTKLLELYTKHCR